MLSLRGLVSVATATLAAGACGGQGGPCEFVYEDAVLSLHSATDARTGAAISRVTIRDVRRDDAPLTGPDQLLGASPRNVTVEGESVICTLACAFGDRDGVYRFTVSAPGYMDLVVSQRAHYARRQAGCPGRVGGSTVVNVVLSPAS